ncbi:ABC-2 transporter permease [Campylobacter hyointestinalis]|uniref:ABC-2 transporter permease n=1 Tax=Campylobacter hyointestinalis TaxID=198 RepID=UPI000DCD0DE5|nr:ABC transporter permease [Campylobacter hyointestinalis]RAZ52832.1 ABC transporter permease [Campylobacter hyointestinalis subsp. lawsonii]
MRLLALIKKEALAIKNDRRSMFVIIVPPLLQILIFAFSVTLEVKNLNLAILNLDSSSYAKEVITKLESAKFIKNITMVKSYEEGKRLITNQKVLAFLVIPKNFSKGENLALVMDGRYSNSAQIANGYIEQTISGLSIDERNFYNPNLDNFWWIVPNLSCSILMVMSIVLTSLSISREREVGTFDQIIVSPLNSFEILLGKLLPAFLISLVLSNVVLFIAYFFFKVPIVGSLWLLYLGTAIFIFCVCSIGLFISVFSNTQQQAILGAFVFLLPSFMLSGFATPIENMPSWLQPISYFVPLTYHIAFVKGVLLKDISFMQSLEYILPMAVFGIIVFIITLIFFRRSILR